MSTNDPMAVGGLPPARSAAPAKDAASGLLDSGVDVAYQPIVQLGSGAVIAYEALARPRRDGMSPTSFFTTLERHGLRLAGERHALRAAVAGAEGKLPGVKLFVNVSPSTLVDPGFPLRELVSLAEEHGLAASDLVVEVTESQAIEDLEELAQRARQLRRLGIALAVDDAGAGHSSFRVITRLRPSYIKMDRDLITGVDGDGARHAFIEAMVRFARQIGSRLIAEGIETEGELVSLAGLGVDGGQGFFLAHPAVDTFVTPSAASRRAIASAAQRLRLGSARVTVGELARSATVADARLSVAEAHARFAADPSLGLLVLSEPTAGDGRFVGQVARRGLQSVLAEPDAWSHVGGRAVAAVAEREPLTLPTHLDLVEAAAVVGSRRLDEVSDDIIVTDARGDLVGVVSVRDILRTLADVRHQGEQDVNPLSGLLGAGWVEGELDVRLAAGEAATVLFLDVDGFRLINDLGGFAAGDAVIRGLARTLTGVAGGVDGAVVAHAGGDDFMFLVPPSRYDELLGELVRSVEAEVVPEVRTILGLRPGASEAVRLGLSIAAIDLLGEPPAGHRHLEWAQNLLAPLMQTAKGHDGHACVHRGDAAMTLTTWAPSLTDGRTVDVGMAEPAVVLRALDIVDDACARWWPSDDQASGASGPSPAFPGPVQEVRRLLTRHAEPLRRRARRAQEAGLTAMEVRLDGDEEELLSLLDRVSVLTRRSDASRFRPVPPELALLDRLLRHRARTLTRQDRVSATEASG